MDAQSAPLNRQTARPLVQAVKHLLTSEVRRRAISLLLLLLLFALAVNGLNVVGSYVGRDFMTAISQRDMAGFFRLVTLYVAVFGATTVVSVFYRFCEERMGLLWRSWLTRRVTFSGPACMPLPRCRQARMKTSWWCHFRPWSRWGTSTSFGSLTGTLRAGVRSPWDGRLAMSWRSPAG